MTLRRHHRFADDVGQISPDGEVPVNPDEAQGWSGDKTSANAKEPAEDTNQKSDHDEINRANVACEIGKNITRSDLRAGVALAQS